MSSLLKFSQGRNQGVGQAGLLSGDFGKIFLEAHSDCLQSPVVCNCRFEDPVSLLSVNQGLLFCVHTPPALLRCPPPLSKPATTLRTGQRKHGDVQIGCCDRVCHELHGSLFDFLMNDLAALHGNKVSAGLGEQEKGNSCFLR